MMPSAKAFPIMPLWRLSMRSTWQRRQSVRRFDISFPASLPDLIWSIWQSFKAIWEKQWTHIWPSLSQTAFLVSRQISIGCRFFGINTLALPHRAIPDLTTLLLSLAHLTLLCRIYKNNNYKPMSCYAGLCQTLPYWTTPYRTMLNSTVFIK